MRIRKRQVPLPLSSLSPVPVSDPHFNRSPVVQLHYKHDPHQNPTQQPDTTISFRPQPSDQQNQPIGTSNDRLDSSSASDDDAGGLAQTQVLLKDEDYERGEEGEKSSNDTRKKNVLGAEMSGGVRLSQLSSSHQVVGRWCEGEKAFPLKKRRGSFERRANEETAVLEKDKKMKTKMKTKMNKKFTLENDSNEPEDKETTKESIDNTTSSAKKRARGGALMEGSRCSRVNGRGWRCCQQTLVGYSLCEHHLGKGRLRSMTSVRSRSLGSTNKKNETDYLHRPLSSSGSLSSIQETKTKRDEVEDGDGDEDEKPLMITKKRMKLGTVKARSISSLLGQTTTNNEVTVADDNINR